MSLRRSRAPVVVLILMLLAAGGVKLALTLRDAGGHSAGLGAASGSASTSRNGIAAADWVSQQVSRSAIVACDPVMCSALEARGRPAASLLVLRTAAADPSRAEVVVVTPAVRSQFGRRLDTVYAPSSVIAGFGSGAARVSVRVTAPDGVAAYLAALRRDVTARKKAGTQLMANKGLKITARARTQLAVGDVDSRLMIVLPALAAVHPVQILAFGDQGPQASRGLPVCSADLSGSGRATGMTDASYLNWLVTFVRAQLRIFSGSTTILRQGEQSVVRVDFSRPSPLGLLNHG